MENYKTKRHLGQNFLQSFSYIQQIIESVPILPYQLVEIGIGLGDLTQELAKRDSLKAYEVDSDLCSLFRKSFASLIASERVELIEQDVLEIEQDQGWLHPHNYILVSNLPYYIATPIILRLLRDSACKYMVVMTQKEVAQKFCAHTKESTFCALSVLAQTFGKPQMLFDVPNTAFKPAPKVTSSVFCIDKTHNRALSDSGFEEFLKIAFRAPRKKLANNLQKTFANITNLLGDLHIRDDARPHEVSTAQYHHIYQHINKETNHGRA